ncbi:redoxin domain-containing protein [Lutibacter flavus]|uniref:Thiol-disulfide isomerase or thioredoxin n=1 Tax=Lutibacter flavus TaxID=691689 RepID=A0A238XN58_9FLAO|nr:thioredoxin-like domain-containing protein [Lutibacter flavus]SNR60102.1 Thiol-disulfide isomerase or thioredoxin [Lutibacter flavus]
MRKIALIITILTFISCKEEAKIDYAILSGKITNSSIDSFTLNSTDRSIKKEVKVLEDGSFIDTLTTEEGTYILYDGKNMAELYINYGDNLGINYDINDFENTLLISGKGSEISNYIWLKSQKYTELTGEGTEIYKKEENDYKVNRLELKNTVSQLLQNAQDLPADFIAKELRNIEYDYISDLNRYERYHEHYAKKKGFKVSDDFLKDVEQVSDFNKEEDFLFSQGYKSIVNSHFRKEAKKLMEVDSISEDLAFLSAAINSENQTIKNHLIYDDAKYGITYTENLEDYYKMFMENSTNEEHIKEITDSYNKLKTVAKGQPSPKFEEYENFAGGTTSLDDLKGKFVYVDVWATWCGPCKAEIPALKEVEAKYHGKNIEFVSVSVDALKDHDKWKKMIEDDELKGIQLFADKSWDSDFVNGYLIKGIPRFILIDPNGNIVSANAPRPSSPKLIKMFNENNI